MDLLGIINGNIGLEVLALFLVPFVFEDVALMIGALLVTNGQMSTGMALTALSLGIVASDWALYGLGHLAARSNYIRSLAANYLTPTAQDILSKNLFWALLIARLVPWLLPPILVMSGFLRVGFRSFVTFGVPIALAYTIIAFSAFFVLDDLLTKYLHAWAVAIAVGLMFVVIGARRYYAHDDLGS